MRSLFKILLGCCLSIVSCSLAIGAEKDDGLNYESMKRFSQAYSIIRQEYVRDVTADELLEGALKGLLQNLDVHSTYLTKEQYDDMKLSTSGEFDGVGIEISVENGMVTVVSPIDDTPAFKAGVKAGDIILEVDGLSTVDMTSQEVVSKIRGPRGTEVKLLLMHKDGKAPEEIAIIRDAIPLTSVKSRFLDTDGYLWVRLSRFTENTTTELLDSLKKMSKEAEITGIVLDLRSNPGGLLDQAVSVSDVFLKEGTIVSMNGRNPRMERVFKAKDRPDDLTVPVVILVNSGSASASEIVAGALKDHNRAVLIGERTFGKGSVQHIIPLDDGSAIKLTVARYYTPNGTSIQAEGIEPDLVVPFEPPHEDAQKPSYYRNLREKDLSRHLENTDNKKDPKAKKLAVITDEAIAQLEKDNQLRLALQMLRGLPRITGVKANE